MTIRLGNTATEGAAGPAGVAGAAGPAWGTDRGAWAGTTAYAANDTVTDNGGSYKAKAAIAAGALTSVNNASGVPRVPDGFISPGATVSGTLRLSKAAESLPGFGGATGYRGYVHQFAVAMAGNVSLPAPCATGGSSIYHHIVDSAGALVAGTQVTGQSAIPPTTLAVGRYYHVIGLHLSGADTPYSVTPSPATNMGAIGTRPALDATNWSVIASPGDAGVAPSSKDIATTAAAVAAGAKATGTINLGKAYRLEKLVVNRACWIRLYASEAHRTADAGRARTADPSGDHGVIAEIFATAGVLALLLLPAPHGYVVSGTTYYSVVNDGVTGDVTFTLTEQVLET